MWANLYMRQWDQYIQFSAYAANNCFLKSLSDPLVVFKQPTDKAYARFRELMQLIDVATLDATQIH